MNNARGQHMAIPGLTSPMMTSEQENEQRQRLVEKQESEANLEKIEKYLSDKIHIMSKDELEDCEEKLKHEFQFFKAISNLGIKIRDLIEHMTLVRSLEVKPLCQEGKFTNKNSIYMVFYGQAEVYKTKNSFKIYNKDGEEVNQSTIGRNTPKIQKNNDYSTGIQNDIDAMDDQIGGRALNLKEPNTAMQKTKLLNSKS